MPSNNYKISKDNALIMFRCKNMSFQEMRFLNVYLSKINPLEEDSRRVVLSLEDFAEWFDLGRLTIPYFREVMKRLLRQIIEIPNGNGGFVSFQLFKEFELYKNEYDEWFVAVDAHDRALPLMFNLKKYTSYKFKYTLNLKSVNQLRIYEILKRHQSYGTLTITLSELRELLGIEEYQYPRWSEFKAAVLEV